MTDRLTDQMKNRADDRAIGRPIKQTSERTKERSTDRPIDRSTDRPTDRPTDHERRTDDRTKKQTSKLIIKREEWSDQTKHLRRGFRETRGNLGKNNSITDIDLEWHHLICSTFSSPQSLFDLPPWVFNLTLNSPVLR